MGTWLYGLWFITLNLDSPPYLCRRDIKSSSKSLMTGKQCRIDPNELYQISSNKALGMEKGRRGEEMGEEREEKKVRKRAGRETC